MTDANLPSALTPPLTTTYASPSGALLGLCSWTTSSPLCYGTVIPIFVSLLCLVILLARGFYQTPTSVLLGQIVPTQKSLLLPESLKALATKDLLEVLKGVNDVPLKTFLPRHGLGELVEPAAALGVAAIRDMLTVNELGLRDIGVGPKQHRIFTRALERKIQLRETMHKAFSLKGPTVAEKARQIAIQNQRENLVRKRGASKALKE